MTRREKAQVEETAAEVEDQETVLADGEDANLETVDQEEELTAESLAEELANAVTVTMEVQVRKLREAMDLLGPVVPKKPTLPVLSYILLKNGQAMACDLETAVVVDLPGVEGQCMVPFRSVLELIKYIPGHEMLAIEQSGKELNLSWSEGKASYETREPDEYPPLPKLDAKVQEIVDGDTLVPALLSMVRYCATGTDKPVLSGVSVFLGDSIEIAAGDGYRMAYRVLPIAIPPADDLNTVIIPANTIEVLDHLWSKAPRTAQEVDSLVELVSSRGKIQLAFGDGKLTARFGPVFVGSQLIGGTPPNFRQLIPSEPPMEVRIYAPDLERAVRRVRKVAEDGKGTVRFAWEDGTMKVSAKAEEKGEVEAKIPVEIQGDPGRVAMNVKYLLEYLKGKTGLVTMGVSSPQSPILFRYAASPLVLIMPMQVQW